MGEMTPAGLAVAPDLDPKLFVFEKWVLDAIKADKPAWKFFKSCPENYRRIKVDRIQHYYHTKRDDYAFKTLRKFIDDCHNGKMQSGWGHLSRLDEAAAAHEILFAPVAALAARREALYGLSVVDALHGAIYPPEAECHLDGIDVAHHPWAVGFRAVDA